MISVEQAKELRALIEQGQAGLDDQTASRAPSLSRRLTGDGALVPAGTRINWQGVLKRAAVDLHDTAQNTPDAAPVLWEDILYRDGMRIIPAVITPGTAFARDELGWWGDTLYRSVYDGANVWTPEQYPSAWEVAA
jgi:hypothetical protein